MLKLQHRLLTALPARTPNLHTDSFTIKYGENSLPESRFGFIVSKKVSKSAVVRNRTKRILRSVIEENLTHIDKGYDMLFIIKQELKTQQEIADTVKTTLVKGKLWH